MIVERQGNAGLITLNRPKALNALSLAMVREITAALHAFQADTAVQLVAIRGTNKTGKPGTPESLFGGFCAGGDISEYPGFRFDAAELRHFHEQEVWGALQAMLDCDVPIIANIQGNCMGAGVEIASCCDIRIAADDVKFGAPIARLGFPMAPREAALVTQATGSSVARAMLLAAEVFDAADMLRCGFLTRVMHADLLAAHVAQLAERVQGLAPQAARMNKQTLRMLNLTAQPRAADPYAYASNAEHREGITAFIEKRKPIF